MFSFTEDDCYREWTDASARIELAVRESAGLQVSLLWTKEVDTLTVAVRDAGCGDAFELVVEDGDALDVFYHPYAHAALRGLSYGVAA